MNVTPEMSEIEAIEGLFRPDQLEGAACDLDVDLDFALDQTFGPIPSPDFPVCSQPSNDCIDPILLTKSPPLPQAQISSSHPDPLRESIDPTPLVEPSNPPQAQINNSHTDSQLSNTHQNLYPDPLQPLSQAPDGPYFMNQAPPDRAQYQPFQEHLTYSNAHPQHGAPFNQRRPLHYTPGPGQVPLQGPAQSQRSQPHSSTKHQGLAQPQNFAQPRFFRRNHFTGEPFEDSANNGPPISKSKHRKTPTKKPEHKRTPIKKPEHRRMPINKPKHNRPPTSKPELRLRTNEPEHSGPSISKPEHWRSSREITCSDRRPLGRVPESWDCFEYNQFGELRPGKTYTVPQIKWYLTRNPQHITHHEYHPKLGGLILWIQRTPHIEDRCHNHRLAFECRLDCCEQRKISPGELRVAFDEQTKKSPNHNPQHNAGYIHLSCLERFFDFPRICASFIVKGEDRVLSDEGLETNCMILQTVGEVDIVDRFVHFCSTNGRAPACYPPRGTLTHTHPSQGTPKRELTLKLEMEILGESPYHSHMQIIWETQGRNGVMVECERVRATKLQLEKDRREEAAQYEMTIPQEVATEKPSRRGKKRAREPEPDSGNDDHNELMGRGWKLVRVSEPEIESETESEPVQKKTTRKGGKTRKAVLKTQSKQRGRKQAREHQPQSRAGSTPRGCSDDAFCEPERKRQKRGAGRKQRVSKKTQQTS